MRSTAVAVATAFALGGCAPEEWSFDAAGDSFGNADAAAPAESGANPPAPDCMSDNDCVQLGKHCNTESGQCVWCVDNGHCTSPGLPICNPLVATCEQCFRSTDCPSGGPDTVPVCDVTQCSFSCEDGGACPASRHLCNTNLPEARCAACLSDSDCADAAGGPRCMTGTCTEGTPFPPVDDSDGAPDSSEAASEASSDVSSGGDHAADGGE